MSDRGEAEYLGDIARIQKELRDGETYEVCLTTAMRCATHAPPPLPLYATLRALNPAPHAAYLRFDPLRLLATDEFGPGGAAVCSSSGFRENIDSIERCFDKAADALGMCKRLSYLPCFREYAAYPWDCKDVC